MPAGLFTMSLSLVVSLLLVDLSLVLTDSQNDGTILNIKLRMRRRAKCNSSLSYVTRSEVLCTYRLDATRAGPGPVNQPYFNSNYNPSKLMVLCY